jgi:pimeloyl-ACP methyl ester carboxylesterase
MALHRTGQALKQTVLPLLPAITAPALVIHGVQDRVVPSAEALLFQQHVPDSQMVLLEECGHFPMYEKFCDYMRSLKVFLGQTSGNPQRFLRA